MEINQLIYRPYNKDSKRYPDSRRFSNTKEMFRAIADHVNNDININATPEEYSIFEAICQERDITEPYESLHDSRYILFTRNNVSRIIGVCTVVPEHAVIRPPISPGEYILRPFEKQLISSDNFDDCGKFINWDGIIKSIPNSVIKDEHDEVRVSISFDNRQRQALLVPLPINICWHYLIYDFNEIFKEGG